MPDCAEFVGARRSKHTMVAYENALYVFGGDNGKKMLNDLLRFDCKELSWAKTFTMGPAPASRYHHSAVVYDKAMYIFGGYTGDIDSNSNLRNKDDLFEYGFATGQWTEKQPEGPLPVARSAHGAAVYNNMLWIFAGYDGNASFVFSGQSGAKITNNLYQFVFGERTWSKITTDHLLRGLSPPPQRRYGHSMVAHGRHLYVFGGAADRTYPNQLHAFDLDTGTWYSIEPSLDSETPCGRVFHASAVIGDAVYIFGGTVDNNIRSSEIYQFQLSSYPKCTLKDDFAQLLCSKEFCDLNFIIGPQEESVLAHVAIVSARSKYLREKILQCRDKGLDNDGLDSEEDPLGENPQARDKELDTDGLEAVFDPLEPTQQVRDKELDKSDSEDGVEPLGGGDCDVDEGRNVVRVYLPEADAESFNVVLNYIYTDRILETFNFEERTLEGVILMVDVYRLAIAFQLSRLELLSLQYMECTVSTENVLAMLEKSTSLNLRYLVDMCMKFVIKDSNYDYIIMSKRFEDISKKLMLSIIRKNHNSLSTTVVDFHKQFVFKAPTLEDDMRMFLLHGGGADFTDVILHVGQARVPAHRVILAARSKYFAALFRFDKMPSEVEVKIGITTPSIQSFMSLMRYTYYGDVVMPPEDSLYLFSATHYFNHTNNRLHAFCKHNLETNVTTKNVMYILEAADSIDADDMKKHCLNIVVRYFKKIVKLEQFAQLRKELLLDIISALSETLGDKDYS